MSEWRMTDEVREWLADKTAAQLREIAADKREKGQRHRYMSAMFLSAAREYDLEAQRRENAETSASPSPPPLQSPSEAG